MKRGSNSLSAMALPRIYFGRGNYKDNNYYLLSNGI
jgi:hypothetical protein